MTRSLRRVIITLFRIFNTGATIVASDRAMLWEISGTHSFILERHLQQLVMMRTTIISLFSLSGYRVSSRRCRYLQLSICSFSLTEFRSRPTAGLEFPIREGFCSVSARK